MRTTMDIDANITGMDFEKSTIEEMINKIIKNAFANNEIDGAKLVQYAKKLKCEKKIIAIMEVMI